VRPHVFLHVHRVESLSDEIHYAQSRRENKFGKLHYLKRRQQQYCQNHKEKAGIIQENKGSVLSVYLI